MEVVSQDLWRILGESHSSSNRALAALTASSSEYIRDPLFRASLLASLPEAELVSFSAEEGAQVLLARAKVAYYSGDTSGSLDYIRRATGQLSTVHSSSSVFVRVHAGIGAILCAEGRYADAKLALLENHRFALRIGNSDLAARAVGNVAYCCLCLGQHDELMEWAGQCIPLSENRNTYHVLLAMSLMARCEAIRGHPSGASSLCEAFTKEFGHHGPQWIQQSAWLYAADTKLLAGQPKVAMEMARRGTSGSNTSLGAAGHAGRFARWVATLAIDAGHVDVALARIDHVLEAFVPDADDYVEVLAAKGLLEEAKGAGGEALHLASQAANKLPHATRELLRCLGSPI